MEKGVPDASHAELLSRWVWNKKDIESDAFDTRSLSDMLDSRGGL